MVVIHKEVLVLMVEVGVIYLFILFCTYKLMLLDCNLVIRWEEGL